MKTPPPPKNLTPAEMNEMVLNQMSKDEQKAPKKRSKKPSEQAPKTCKKKPSELAAEEIRITNDSIIPRIDLPAVPTLDIVPNDTVSEKVKILELGNSRCWSVIVYQHYDKRHIDAFLEDLFGRRGLSGCLSPLHDEDLYSDGTRKEPHWHLLIHSDRTLSAALPLAISYALNGNFPPVEPVVNEGKMYNYHIHLFNRDKTLYKDSDRTLYNGYAIPNTECVLKQLFEIAGQCKNLNELTVFCVANHPYLLTYIERYFRTLKAFYNANY